MHMPAGADTLRKEGGIPSLACGGVDGDVAGVEDLLGELLGSLSDADRGQGSQGNFRKLGGRFSFQAERPSSPSSER